MSVKEEIHDLVDQLEDEAAPEALAYMRSLLGREVSGEGAALSRLNNRLGRSMVPGREFFSNAGDLDLAALAEKQGVTPIDNPDDLRADFWPEGESIDEFVETVRQWRREGGYG